ncbi:MAG: biotin/lipoyl-binding protein [Bryobacterales bacterium]|nr:biotin/lipoyl-binding protein [Bryobacterales bacterium]MBV9397592.1 biotin/lipoyl-binding protein [Bryobacterales bacterium]
MKVETIIQGRAGRLGFEGQHFRYEREDGQSIESEFSAARQDAGTHTILIGGRSYRITRGAPGETLVNGWPIAVEVVDPRGLRARKSSTSGSGRQEVSAPMPGKVVRVLVAPGDMVEAGQGLLVVEAMKMQNEMKSPKAGRVVEVRTRADSAVRPGEPLVIVE